MFKKVLLTFLIILSIFPLSSCSKETKQEVDSLRIGMVVGGIFDQYIPDAFPGAEVEYFYSASDLPLALQSGKIDLYLDDELSAKEHCKVYTNQRIDRVIHDDEYGFIFNKKNEELKNQVDDFLTMIEEDGRLAELKNIWLYGDDESLKVVNYEDLVDINGTIKVGIAPTMPPLDYIKDGKYMGYEVAILDAFCREYGYGISFQNSDFSSTMASVTAGSCDIGSASYSITEERKQNMLFSKPTMTANCVSVVKEENVSSEVIETNIEKIGVVTGALFDVAVKNNNPNAQIEYFNYTSDLPTALNGGKLTGYTVDEPVARMLCNIYPDHYIDKKLTIEQYGIVINKEKPYLQEQFNEYLASLSASGELLVMQRMWMGADESEKVIDFDSLANNTGEVLKYATTSSMQPFDYIKDGRYAGYEIALVASFCKEYGYGLQIEDSNFTGVLAAVSTGKADLGSCVITITDERKETMNFTNTVFEGGIVLVRKKDTNGEVDPFADLAGKSLGVQLGSSYDQFVIDNIRNSNVEYFNSVADMRTALDANKISGFIVDKPVADLLLNKNKGEYKTTSTLYEVNYGIVLPKDKPSTEKLYRKLDNYLSKLKQNGKLAATYDFWTNENSINGPISYKDLPNINGEIVLAVSSETGAPFVYKENEQYYGFDIDLMYQFCEENGYSLRIDDYSFSGLLMAVSSDKCDVAIGGITITEERKDVMLFVDEQIKGGCVVVVKNENGNADAEKIEGGIIDSFYKTFIKEERWKLFISGILTTILITALAILIGTFLGFQIYMLYRNNKGYLKHIVDFFRNLILKTPTVVILMIFYYIIFGRIEISGIAVSIIGLSILFANSVVGLIIMGANTIDKGQMEAALSLGYSRRKAFIEIILPQAMINVTPGYKSAVITLIKESAIVGYIAVQDLTKVGDIIRSRTYEAFFPLIATAVIYYIISTIFIHLANRIEFKLNPKNRTSLKVLEGVKLDD